MFLSLLMSLAFAADVTKLPCVLHLVKPAWCDTDMRCVSVTNHKKDIALAPIISGVCDVGTVSVNDARGDMQVVFDPERRIYVPVLAPANSPFPSSGWMYLPAGTNQVTAVAYGGAFAGLYPVPGTPFRAFDDDPALDAEDHIVLGRCRVQKIVAGTHRSVRLESSCSMPELAASRGR